MSRSFPLAAVAILFGLGLTARAETISVVAGSITSNLVVDSGGNPLALDLRGAALVSDGTNADVLTDAFASPTFGNVVLTDIDILSSAVIKVNFNPLTLVRSGLDLSVDTTGLLISGSPTALGSALIAPEVFNFVLSNITPIGGTADTELTYILTSITAPTTSTVPEPATFGMTAIFLASLVLARKRLWVR